VRRCGVSPASNRDVAVFNMTTQFGGGKTHALTLLYHLASTGRRQGSEWCEPGPRSGERGQYPQGATAVSSGRSSTRSLGEGARTALRCGRLPGPKSPSNLGVNQDLPSSPSMRKQMTAPAGDVIRRILPKGKPCLILMDELMNYVSRTRRAASRRSYTTFSRPLRNRARRE